MKVIIILLMAPFILLTALGGIGSAIWLGFLGKWWAIGIGVAILLSSTFLLSFAMIPGMALTALGIALTERGRTILASPFLLASTLYIYAIIIVWCLAVFYTFMSRAEPECFWPLLIWSYTVALGPLDYMAQKDGSSASWFANFISTISFISMSVVGILTNSSFIDLSVVFSAIMLFGLVLQTVIAPFASRTR